MDFLTRRAIAAQLAVTACMTGLMERGAARRDAGQGSVEYIGIILVVVAIVAVIIKAVDGSSIGTTVIGKIEDAISKVK
ncbi:hypothetical protein [Cellulomonas sp. URHB0016]